MCIRDRDNEDPRHFIEDNHKFVNPLEEYEIVKVVNNTVERKLKE